MVGPNQVRRATWSLLLRNSTATAEIAQSWFCPAVQKPNLLHMHFSFPSATNNCPFSIVDSFPHVSLLLRKKKKKKKYIIKVFRWQFHAQNSSTLILSSLSLWEKIQLKKLKKMAGVGQFPRLCTVTWLNKQSPYLLLQWIMIAYKTSWHYCTMRPVFDS
jgi:hypothetical protein